MTFLPSKFKIWYSHQVPGPSYEQEVPNPAVGQAILDAVYQVALYQFANTMIPDYCNAGGVLYLDEDGEWVDFDPEDWALQFVNHGLLQARNGDFRYQIRENSAELGPWFLDVFNDNHTAHVARISHLPSREDAERRANQHVLETWG